jgi:hypothetical protein
MTGNPVTGNRLALICDCDGVLIDSEARERGIALRRHEDRIETACWAA